MPNRSTFVTQGEAYKIKSLKENRDGFCKVFFHVPHFIEPQPVVKKFFAVLSLHISNIWAKKNGIAKKLIQTFRAIVISQEVDLGSR